MTECSSGDRGGLPLADPVASRIWSPSRRRAHVRRSIEQRAGLGHRRRGDRCRRGRPGDLLGRLRVRWLPRLLPGRRHRPVPRGSRAGARDPRVEGRRTRRGGKRAGRGGGRARGRRHGDRAEHVRQPQPGLPHRRRRHHGRDAPHGDHLPRDRSVQARQPDPVRAVPRRRRLPGRDRMAPPQGQRRRGLRGGGAHGHDRLRDRVGGAQAVAPRPRVRRDPAGRRPAGAATAGDPDRARRRDRGVRDRHARHGLIARGRADRVLDARTVPLRSAVRAVDRAVAHRRRLGGRPRPSRRHRHRGARRGTRRPVPRQRHRDRTRPGPGYEQGTPRRRVAQRRRLERSAGSPGTTHSA